MEDFVRTLVEYFLERRERGAAISGADQHLLRLWASIGAVRAGIDAAFDRRSDPPRSLKDCGRWVRAEIRREREPTAIDEVFGSDARTMPTARMEDEVLDRIRTLRDAEADHARREALDELYRDLDDILLTEGAIDADTLALLDEALVEAVIVRLEPAAREAVFERLRRQPSGGGAQRTRLLREALGLPSLLT